MPNTESLTTESLNVFLATVRAELDSYKRFMEMHAPQLAPGFNLVNCFNPNENKLSAVIAMLLDPNGGHGQGALFLKSFLDVLTGDLPKDHPVAVKLNRIQKMSDNFLQSISATPALEVATSHIQDNQRRIDILLHFNVPNTKGFGIAIENKPWACDQDEQLIAYDNHLSNAENYREDGFVQIYLSGSGEFPEENSIKREQWNTLELEKGRLVMMTYSQLKQWCSDSAEKCKAPRVRYFIEDFAEYIRDKFEGDIPMTEEKMIVNNALKPENISAAVAVGFAWPSISRSLIEKLVDLTFEYANIDKNNWKHQIDFDINNKWSKIVIARKEWEKYSIGFEFESKNANDFCYGIMVSTSIPEQDIISICNAFNSDGLEAGQKSTTWPWYRKFEEPFRNWSNTDLPWIEIRQGGQTVELIASKIKMLTNICDRENAK